MKFSFQFESLLKIRRHEEKQEQQVLGELLEKKKGLAGKVELYRDKLKNLDGKAFETEKIMTSNMRQQYAYKQDLQSKIWELQQDMNRLKNEVERQRKQLLEANKKTQMLEKLKGRERAQFLEDVQHIEQKQQDEIATQIFNRTR